MADNIAKLELPGNDSIDLPIKKGTEGFDVIDISTLGKKGYFTFDPGFLATASCESAITYKIANCCVNEAGSKVSCCIVVIQLTNLLLNRHT